ncbi:diaminopimelate epimerase [uncultured Tateyamaria sp.]|uniref:diaminopimelate epimerase n=1 Tax=uncultured Tateyamaria sp. TaxID=455651 RepID=UPI0026191884|nr:diaminopimelate epimerase [uncultured Tateyamaria sp.]
MRRMQQSPITQWPFMKMHGLGNDFVVVDARAHDVALDAVLVRALADRHRGVGFDQLAVISEGTDLTLTFYNADGSHSAACGNATRCIAAREMAMTGQSRLDIDITGRGTLQAAQGADGITSVNMGHPQTEWQDVPLSHAVDTLALPIEGTPVATGMGNPHCTFFVDDLNAVDLNTIGPQIEHHPLFPERTNVQFAHLVGPDHIRMRVWERGTGVTLASGSSSCATAIAAHRRGLTGRAVRVDLDGGTLQIDWRDDGVWMSGPTAHVFDGTLTQEFLDSL